MQRNPKEILDEARKTAERLGNQDEAHWNPGRCDRLAPGEKAPAGAKSDAWCGQAGHPHECDVALNNGGLGPLPERPTVKHLREALIMARADASEVIRDLCILVEGQQRQLDALSRKHAVHRHKVGDGHFSDRADE